MQSRDSIADSIKQKKKICELEDKSFEIIQAEEKKRIKKRNLA